MEVAQRSHEVAVGIAMPQRPYRGRRKIAAASVTLWNHYKIVVSVSMLVLVLSSGWNDKFCLCRSAHYKILNHGLYQILSGNNPIQSDCNELRNFFRHLGIIFSPLSSLSHPHVCIPSPLFHVSFLLPSLSPLLLPLVRHHPHPSSLLTSPLLPTTLSSRAPSLFNLSLFLPLSIPQFSSLSHYLVQSSSPIMTIAIIVEPWKRTTDPTLLFLIASHVSPSLALLTYHHGQKLEKN